MLAYFVLYTEKMLNIIVKCFFVLSFVGLHKLIRIKTCSYKFYVNLQTMKTSLTMMFMNSLYSFKDSKINIMIINSIIKNIDARLVSYF